MPSLRLTGIHVRQVYLDKRQIRGRQCVAEGDAGVCVRPRIDHDTVGNPAPRVQLVDERPFTIRLKSPHLSAEVGRHCTAPRDDLVEGHGAVDRRFTGAEQIEIGTVQYADDHKFPNPLSHWENWARSLPAPGAPGAAALVPSPEAGPLS